MSRCMRVPQVVRLCVPLLLVWQRRVGAMPRARIALRRRRARACNWHKIICGCISLVNDVGDASSCIGMHIYAVAHSSAATRCFLAVILASFLYRLLRWLSDVGLFSRLLVSAPTESYHLYSRSFSPTEGNHGTYSPFSGGENPTPKTNQPQTLDLRPSPLPLPPNHGLQQLLEPLLVADGASQVARDVRSFFRDHQSERGPHVRRQL